MSLQDQIQTLSRPASIASSMSIRSDSEFEGEDFEENEPTDRLDYVQDEPPGKGSELLESKAEEEYDSDTTLKAEDDEIGGRTQEGEKEKGEEGEFTACFNLLPVTGWELLLLQRANG